jgi:ubiquinone/menaquinone biosynthesis C-methylase UbiE
MPFGKSCAIHFSKILSKQFYSLDIGQVVQFINNIRCQKKFAVDLNQQISHFANANVTVIHSSSTRLDSFQNNSVDVVFMSNFLEHLKSKDEVHLTLAEMYRVLKQSYFNDSSTNIRFLYVNIGIFYYIVPSGDRAYGDFAGNRFDIQK